MFQSVGAQVRSLRIILASTFHYLRFIDAWSKNQKTCLDIVEGWHCLTENLFLQNVRQVSIIKQSKCNNFFVQWADLSMPSKAPVSTVSMAQWLNPRLVTNFKSPKAPLRINLMGFPLISSFIRAWVLFQASVGTCGVMEEELNAWPTKSPRELLHVTKTSPPFRLF